MHKELEHIKTMSTLNNVKDESSGSF